VPAVLGKQAILKVSMSHRSKVLLSTDSFPQDPAFDTAVSRALCQLASEGKRPATLRLHRPGPVIAFGRQDVASTRYPEALEAASRCGYASVERLAGGRAAIFHKDTVAFAWAVPEQYPPRRTYERFFQASEILRDALFKLGVDARVGEIPGEYCPGKYSVNARGQTKLVGLGQRLLAHAAHVGGVIVCDGSAEIRTTLEPVYEALGLSFEPATVGSICDEVGFCDFDRTRDAIVEQFEHRYEVIRQPLDDNTLSLADQLANDHRVPNAETTST
jgi:octanoyl-[GcvH]:protein N-octanoyltransferase